MGWRMTFETRYLMTLIGQHMSQARAQITAADNHYVCHGYS